MTKSIASQTAPTHAPFRDRTGKTTGEIVFTSDAFQTVCMEDDKHERDLLVVVNASETDTAKKLALAACEQLGYPAPTGKIVASHLSRDMLPYLKSGMYSAYAGQTPDGKIEALPLTYTKQLKATPEAAAKGRAVKHIMSEILTHVGEGPSAIDNEPVKLKGDAFDHKLLQSRTTRPDGSIGARALFPVLVS